MSRVYVEVYYNVAFRDEVQAALKAMHDKHPEWELNDNPEWPISEVAVMDRAGMAER